MSGVIWSSQGIRPRCAHRSVCALFFLIFLLLSYAAGQTASVKKDSSQAEIDRIRRMLETPEWRNAEPAARAFVEKNPASADGHALLGLVLYRLHQPRASMAEFLKAAETDELSAFDLRIFALDCAGIPDYPEAEKWLLRSIGKDPADSASWEALGHVRFAEQHYEAAIEALTHALALSPRTVSAESLIGLANERLARPEAARAAYRTALEWQSDAAEKDPVPYLGMGRLDLAEDHAAVALEWLRTAAAQAHAPVEAHELLGLALSKTGANAEAVVELQTAIHLDPKSARLHLMLSRIYRALGDQTNAQAEQARYTELKASSAQ